MPRSFSICQLSCREQERERDREPGFLDLRQQKKRARRQKKKRCISSKGNEEEGQPKVGCPEVPTLTPLSFSSSFLPFFICSLLYVQICSARIRSHRRIQMDNPLSLGCRLGCRCCSLTRLKLRLLILRNRY